MCGGGTRLRPAQRPLPRGRRRGGDQPVALRRRRLATPGMVAAEIRVLADPGVHRDRGSGGRVDRPRRAELRDRERSVAYRPGTFGAVSYTHLRAHETDSY